MAETKAPLRTVEVVDRGTGRGYQGVTIRRVTVRWVCPRCGRGRGEPERFRFPEDGEWFVCDRWVNPCGNVDLYCEVIAEARSLEGIPSGPIDTGTAQVLEDVASATHNRLDRERVVAAIRDCGRELDGRVDPNRVREYLRGEHGLVVNSRVIGAVYSSMVRTGELTTDGWTTSTDADGGNAGKPARLYRIWDLPAGVR